MSGPGEGTNHVKYIYDLPYRIRKHLCSILDMDSTWERLGGEFMNMRDDQLDEFRRAGRCPQGSPTHWLLQASGNNNLTVNNLFFMLWEMKHFRAMRVISSCVPEKYHTLFKNDERQISTASFQKAVPRPVDNNQQQHQAPAPAPSHSLTATSDNQGVLKVPVTVSGGGGREELEGACALPPVASHYHSPDNLNQPQKSSGWGGPGGGKVPSSLLRTKIDNTSFRAEEVSCEDNNAGDRQCTTYNAGEDYAREARKVEEKAKLTQGGGLGSGGGAEGRQQTVVASPSTTTTPNRLTSGERRRKISSQAELCTSVPKIPYKELEEATHGWSPDNLLGRGGFGSVFKGTWKNTEVAVKRIEPHSNASLDNSQLHISQSLEELKLLQSFPHNNILQVYGYSMDEDLHPCLMYQFMPNGSVEDRLQCRKISAFGCHLPHEGLAPLTWWQRFRVALGTACALQYLHTVNSSPLIHGDVKSANILLDQNFEPKLGDFGLAREGKSQTTSMKVSRVHGTKPYLPDEYLRSKKLSVKVDTYSYGIVLFELCTGLRAYDEKRKENKFLKDLVDRTEDIQQLRDEKAGYEPTDDIFHFLFKLGKRCVVYMSKERPEMKVVFKDLQHCKLVMEDKAQQRKISTGESSIVSNPQQLQVYRDTFSHASAAPSLSPGFYPPQLSSPSTASLSHSPRYSSPLANGQVYMGNGVVAYPRLMHHLPARSPTPADLVYRLTHQPHSPSPPLRVPYPANSLPRHPFPLSHPNQVPPPPYSEVMDTQQQVTVQLAQLGVTDSNHSSTSTTSTDFTNSEISIMENGASELRSGQPPTTIQQPSESAVKAEAFLPMLSALGTTSASDVVSSQPSAQGRATTSDLVNSQPSALGKMLDF